MAGHGHESACARPNALLVTGLARSWVLRWHGLEARVGGGRTSASPDAAKDKGEIRLLFGWQDGLRQGKK